MRVRAHGVQGDWDLHSLDTQRLELRDHLSCFFIVEDVAVCLLKSRLESQRQRSASLLEGRRGAERFQGIWWKEGGGLGECDERFLGGRVETEDCEWGGALLEE